MLIISEQDDANCVLIHIECNAQQIARELDQLLKSDVGKAGNHGDARGNIGNDAHFARRHLRHECFSGLTQVGERAIDGGLQEIGRSGHLAAACAVDFGAAAFSGLGFGATLDCCLD